MMFNRTLKALAAFVAAQALVAHAQNAAPAENSALNGELFYQLLLGELTASSDPGTGYALILDAARKTSDPRLYQRAVDIALRARSGESALQAARAWRLALPQSREANRQILQILINLNRIPETVEPLRREITQATASERPAVIAALPRFFSRVTDRKLAVQTLEQVLADQLNQPATGVAAWTALGRLRLDAGDASGALEAAQRAQALEPQAAAPALLAMETLTKLPAPSEAIVRRYLNGKPEPEVRMAYARALLDAMRYTEAAAQLRQITRERPDLADAWLIQGSLELQEKNDASAERSLKTYLSLKDRTPAAGTTEQDRGLVQAYLLLAQLAERRKNFAEAEGWLNRIQSSEDMVRVQSRRAAILARQGRLDEARQLIRSLPERSAADARFKVNAEVQLLRDSKQYRAAFDVLAQYVERNPDDHDQRYDLATLAEKMGDTATMERLLRQIIAARPDYHHAYNALGYSLADRNIRLDEARQLILKALEFAPGDPFITDSLGWLEFRAGNLGKAQEILQQAYAARADAEIAAHLGEVLWNLQRRDDALKIWREGLSQDADNETLRETLQRLGVRL